MSSFMSDAGADYLGAMTDMAGDLGGWESVDAALFSFNPEEAWSPWNESGEIAVIGSPDGDAGFWQEQTTDFTCAVVAQRGILESFGQNVSEAQLVYDATVNGWLSDQGTSPAHLGQLLEYYGIPCHDNVNASLDDLAGELARGHKVLVGVDSGELAGTDSPLEDFFGERADHAVQVTGIVRDPNGQVWVTLNDPGTPDGQGVMHPWETFADAWADSGNYYVATTIAPGAALAGPGGEFDLGQSLENIAVEAASSAIDWATSPEGVNTIGAGIALYFGIPEFAPVIAEGVGALSEAMLNEFAQNL